MGGGGGLLITVKSHLELHHELNSTLPPVELHPEVTEVEQVPGAYSFLNRFIMLYNYNPKISDELSIYLLHGAVAYISGNHNPRFPLKA